MVVEKRGDIFTSTARGIVNPVNCVGVMGGGLALEFRHRYPEMYARYREQCLARMYRPGDVFAYPRGRETYIFNMATKGDWRMPTLKEWVERGLENLKVAMRAAGVEMTALPLVGAGLGGLDPVWVRLQVYREFEGDLEFDVELWER